LPAARTRRPLSRAREAAPAQRGHVCTLTEKSVDASSFRCLQCRQQVNLSVFGTAHRNHCPNCLWSRHVDLTPGDRRAECKARMEPVAIASRQDGEWAIIHRCLGCGVLKDNRVAGDDNMLVLMAIAARPLASPPVPLEYLGGR
jgi:hypothetical protein